jgi:hypothetical protein
MHVAMKKEFIFSDDQVADGVRDGFEKSNFLFFQTPAYLLPQ